MRKDLLARPRTLLMNIRNPSAYGCIDMVHLFISISEKRYNFALQFILPNSYNL